MNFEGLLPPWRSVLASRLASLRRTRPHLFRLIDRGATLGQTGLVLAQPVWARPERQFLRLAEPLVAVAATLTLVLACLSGLTSLAALLAAVAVILVILRAVFGIHLEAPGAQAA